MSNDLVYALRGLRRQPTFAAVAVLTLALGIGANTAIFSLLYHVLLRPLRYPDAERLVFVWNAYKKAGHEFSDVSIGVLPPDFEIPSRDVAVLLPFAFTAVQRSDQECGNKFSEMIARLRPDSTIDPVNGQMDAIAVRLMDRVPARAA
jgi:hypothetical protein